ncbi:MAG TPA: hypothetical protein VEN30_14960 [Paraburkholderia sp.]|nr:hypothetical protein [Paraburkholderia sp.]
MKVVTGSIVMSALMIGVAGAAYAQTDNPGVSGMKGAPSGVNSVGGGAGTGLGTGASPSATPGMGTAGGSTAMGGAGGARSGPVLNNMRANGTSLNMNPDPRAPNLTGKAFSTR